MKQVNLATLLIPACLVLACGTKKNEKKVPVAIDNQSSDSTVQDEFESNQDCNDSVNQNQNCPSPEFGEMLVLQQKSWLNSKFRADGSLQSHDGICLDKFMAGKADDNSLASMEMSLSRMELKDAAARCRMQVRVAYKKGYAFAIRKVEVPLIGRIPVDARAVFDGSYGIQGRKSLVMRKTLESRYTNKPLRLDHSVSDQDIVWSSCSGQATLMVDTGLSLNFSGSNQDGDLRIEGTTPYRFEVLWAKCL